MVKVIACPVCDGRGRIFWTNATDDTCSAGSKPCPHCSGTGQREVAMTNADRIRAMTDEELAELLANETYRIAKPCFDAFGYGLEKQIIYVKRLSWLQQPAEEG